ncbi:MAG: hypothetical protein CMJ48_08290 [Planctomycetaceae bacterium]|nr:hypothetical protein [Planctomycetaceae bacterium]
MAIVFGMAWQIVPPTLVLAADAPAAKAPSKVRLRDRIPYGWKPVDYLGVDVDDPIDRLRKRIDAGETRLRLEQPGGLLRSFLSELKIPISSQVLVFSKTAVNHRLIKPSHPRSIYFNDNVYVGWVPGAKTLEIASVDPQKGSLFYTWSQRGDAEVRPIRDDGCLTCHASSSTLQVPGLMVRSFETDATGRPTAGFSEISHDTELAKRWGGWYVTGRHGRQTHLGNHFGREQNAKYKDDPTFGGNLTETADLFDSTEYLSPHSDLVAHLVLNHQTHAHNLITRVNFEHRLNLKSDAEDLLFRYMLFVDETTLTEPVSGTTDYAGWFEKQGKLDKQGRSLRQLDLKTRLLKHRLSYLVYTESFDSLPKPVKNRFYKRLWSFLKGENLDEDFEKIPQRERDAILEILRATKPGLPESWRK